MSGQSPTKKARGSVEDKEMLPVTEGTQPEFEKDVDEEFEMKRKQARLDKFEEISFALAMQESVDNEKIEEKTEEMEPSQPATKKEVNQTVGVEMQSAIDLKNVLKKVWQSSYGSQDNMSVMMTGL